MRILEVTTNIGCKIGCAYCPQEKLLTAYSQRSKISQMSFDVFKKCIDKVPKDSIICFSGFSEPWLNHNCTRMLLYAHKNGFQVQAFTTTVGMSLSDIQVIKTIPFALPFGLWVHLPDDQGLTRITVDGKYLQIISELISNSIANLNFHYHILNGKGSDIHHLLRALLARENVSFHAEPILTRAGNLTYNGSEPLPKKNFVLNRCQRLYNNILLPNGEVALCCHDFGLRHILGNLIESDYHSLFNSAAFLTILKGLNNKHSDILCRYCEGAGKNHLMLRPLKYFKRLISRSK